MNRESTTRRRPRPLRPRVLTHVLAVAILLTGALPAAAQTTRAATRPTTRPAGAGTGAPVALDAARGLLAGPRVEATALDEAAGAPDRSGTLARIGAVPARRWFVLVRELGLTPAQRTASQQIVRELQQERRRFERTHGAELATLRKTRRAARRDGTPLDGEMRDRLRAIEADAPKVALFQRRVWDLLDADQRRRLRAALNEERRVRAEKRRRDSRR